MGKDGSKKGTKNKKMILDRSWYYAKRNRKIHDQKWTNDGRNSKVSMSDSTDIVQYTILKRRPKGKCKHNQEAKKKVNNC